MVAGGRSDTASYSPIWPWLPTLPPGLLPSHAHSHAQYTTQCGSHPFNPSPLPSLPPLTSTTLFSIRPITSLPSLLAGNVNMVLPVVWLWEMVDEFLYQFQSFCQYSVKLQQKSAEEIANLKQCKVGWVNAQKGGGGWNKGRGGGGMTT